MKLKDRPLAWWRGRSFQNWCNADPDDDRKIYYTVNHRSIGQGLRVLTFTSEEYVDPMIMYYLETGTINSLKLINNEWHVIIDAGIIPDELYK